MTSRTERITQLIDSGLSPASILVSLAPAANETLKKTDAGKFEYFDNMCEDLKVYATLVFERFGEYENNDTLQAEILSCIKRAENNVYDKYSILNTLERALVMQSKFDKTECNSLIQYNKECQVALEMYQTYSAICAVVAKYDLASTLKNG